MGGAPCFSAQRTRLSWHPEHDCMAPQRLSCVATRPRLAGAIFSFRAIQAIRIFHPPQGSVTCRLTGLPGALAWLVHLESSLYSFWFSISLPLSALCLCSAAALFGHSRLTILSLHSSTTPSEWFGPRQEAMTLARLMDAAAVSPSGSARPVNM